MYCLEESKNLYMYYISSQFVPQGHVVVVNPLLPDYWGESASVVLWGFAASFSRQSSSRAATPEGSLHKSRADSVVRICGQLKRCRVVCSWVRQRGQSGDGCVDASILCRYDKRKGDLFVLSWARVRRVCRGKFPSVLLTCGGCVRSILLLSLAARCWETIVVCIRQ